MHLSQCIKAEADLDIHSSLRQEEEHSLKKLWMKNYLLILILSLVVDNLI